MPAVRPSAKMTSFGQDSWAWNGVVGAVGYGVQGTWGALLNFKDISFAKDLKHNVRVAYYRGTNDADLIKKYGPAGSDLKGIIKDYRGTAAAGANPGLLYLTDKDSAWEFNVDTYYDIYKNLQLCVELGYIKLNMDDGTWRQRDGSTFADRAENQYKVTIGLRYMF
jgi:hypothetical protein